MNGRYFTYELDSGKLTDTNLLFESKVSSELNALMYEAKVRFESAPGNYSEKVVYYWTANFTKGEQIKYFFDFNTQ